MAFRGPSLDQSTSFFFLFFYRPYDSIRRGFFDGLFFYFYPLGHQFTLLVFVRFGSVRFVFSGVVAMMGGGAKEEESHVSSVRSEYLQDWVAGWSKGC